MLAKADAIQIGRTQFNDCTALSDLVTVFAKAMTIDHNSVEVIIRDFRLGFIEILKHKGCSAGAFFLPGLPGAGSDLIKLPGKRSVVIIQCLFRIGVQYGLVDFRLVKLVFGRIELCLKLAQAVRA